MNTAQTNVYNDDVQRFTFVWVENIFFLKVKAVETKAEVKGTILEIESQIQYLKFIKKKMKSFKLPLSNIKEIKSRGLFKKCVVILTTNLNNEIRIPTNNKVIAHRFISTLKNNIG